VKVLTQILVLARLPFHIIGVLPVAAGALMAYRVTGVFDPAVFLLSLAAVILTISATHFNGERYDIGEDSRCAQRTVFSSGTGLAVSGAASLPFIEKAAAAAAVSALAIGCILQFGFRTGPYTLALGAAALVPAYYYSKPPVRLVKRGVGELMIGICYGLLAPASGFYPQAGRFHPALWLMALPVGIATVSVVWINEILDFDCDSAAGKKNLVVRLGLARAAGMYKILALAGSISCIPAMSALCPGRTCLYFLPALVFLAAAAVLSGTRGRTLLVACGAAIAADVAMNAAFIALFL
jgi:1,4-dihydroxy-2-naphthoate polyprenyltransferase